LADIRPVTAGFAVAPQIETADLPALAEHGYRLVINNRPDHEVPGQPTSDEMAMAAEVAGIDYLHIAIRGMATPEQAAAMKAAIDNADGAVLAFCRSGTRSITAWAVGQALAGAPRSPLIEAAARAGYDLSAVLGG
jgi:uncharacterized protein (TIGR01244 family)